MSPCSILVNWLGFNLKLYTVKFTVLAYVRAYIFFIFSMIPRYFICISAWQEFRILFETLSLEVV